jgi:hypothetical protein
VLFDYARRSTLRRLISDSVPSTSAAEALHSAPIRRGGVDQIFGQYDIEYYEQSRTHLELDKDTPVSRAVSPPTAGRIVALPQVGGPSPIRAHRRVISFARLRRSASQGNRSVRILYAMSLNVQPSARAHRCSLEPMPARTRSGAQQEPRSSFQQRQLSAAFIKVFCRAALNRRM